MKRKFFFLATCFLMTWCTISSADYPGRGEAILVTGSAQSAPAVRVITGEADLSLTETENALLFFPPRETLPERWVSLPNEKSLAELRNEQLRTVGPSRGFGGSIADAIQAQTTPLAQIQIVLANRSVPQYAVPTIFSPKNDSTILHPRPTFRRLPVTDEQTKTSSYPAVTARVLRAGRQVLEISFAENRDAVTWGEIPDSPEGLEPGEYTIQIDGATQTFTVADDWTDQHFARIESLLGKDDPVFVQIAAETLAQDIEGPFYTDALDRIAALPKDKSTPYLEGFSKYLTIRLSGREDIVRGSDGRLPQDEVEKSEEKKADENVSADAAFIHKLLLNEKWSEASKRLDGLEKKLSEVSDSWEIIELKALCHLYRGMILAESGMTKRHEAHSEFTKALLELQFITPGWTEDEQAVAASRFRAANNYGNYILQLMQDCVGAHSLAIATGNGSILTEVLFMWNEALDLYRQALDVAEKYLADQPELAAACKVNKARLYALLGDIVRTVDRGPEAAEIEKGAYATAEKLAREVLERNLPDEDRLAGTAHHLLADIAFRRGDKTLCRSEAETARAFYVRTGTLSGVEAIERLLGIAETADRTVAMRHLFISNAISEVLREQIPADEIGLSRAGFFARRAYVNECLIGLLLEEGNPVEALTALEAAKGRSLKDVLAGAGIRNADDETAEIRGVEEILADWPKDVAAVEYFVGSESCHGFLIIDGNVEAFELLDDGKPIPSRELIAAVQHYLSDTESQGGEKGKMIRRLLRREGFDREWESALYRLRTCLLPDAILDKLRESQAENVLIVPQHILHYLPFAALVVEQDKNYVPKTMPMPKKFVLDEPFDVVQAPSLAVWDSLRRLENRPMNSVAAVGISAFSYAQSLNGTKKDIESVENAFGSERVQTIVEDAATKAAVKTVLGQRGLLLVGTHGANSPQSPLQGCLLLRSGDGDDDTITAEEIFETTVGSDLVILSACYSGMADQSPLPGDDLFGIQRALLHGGARAVIAGTWDVYDMTGPVIVDELLKRLAAGEPVSAALAGAQRAFLERQRSEGSGNPFTHPYFWAVYTLTGDGRVQAAVNKLDGVSRGDIGDGGGTGG